MSFLVYNKQLTLVPFFNHKMTFRRRIVMTNQAFLHSVLTGLLFGIWPLIIRATNISPMWTAATITIGSVIMIIPAILLYEPHVPTAKTLLVGIIAGVISGLGLIEYGKLLTTPEWKVTVTVPIALVVTPIVLVVGGWMFFHESITPTKACGSMLGILAIYLMCK